MGLVDKLRESGKRAKILALAGVLGSSVYLSGCAGIELGPLKPGPLHPSRLLFDGTVFSNQNQQQQTTNSYGNVPNNDSRFIGARDPHDRLSTPFGNLLVVSCNYTKDFNRNNKIDYPEEFVGIKNEFSTEELIEVRLFVIASAMDRETFPEITYQLLNNRGELLENFSHMNMYSSGGLYGQKEEDIKKEYSDGKMLKGINKLSPGNYRAVWYSEGKFVAMHDFRVCER